MLVKERIARTLITAGGIGTILAVTLIFVFLAWVVFPLFASPHTLGSESVEALDATSAPFRFDTDEDRVLAWTLHRDGALELVALESGERIALTHPFGETVPVSASFSTAGDVAVFGFADGTIRVGNVGFETEMLDEAVAAPELHALSTGEVATRGAGVVERTTAGQLRRTTVGFELGEPLDTQNPSPVICIDHAVTPSGLSIVTLQENGALRVSRERTKKNLMTGKVTVSLRSAELAAPIEGAAPEVPRGILIDGLGQHVYVVFADGTTEHWNLADFSAPRLFERIDLIEDPDARLSVVAFVGGRRTLIVGDSSGRVDSWFPARAAGSDDDALLIRAQRFEPGDSPAILVAASPRSRMIAVAFASGSIALYQATLGERLLEIDGDEQAGALTVAPREDAIVARTSSRIASVEIDLKYPEAAVSALIAPVWYEGYPAPTHVWQSSSASDDFEPKLGLMPLVFGTLKATLYSLLFGAPLAILAAIYTSEFMAPRLRASVKSTVELMASLPSVVLGFIGALVIAPFVQDVLPSVLAMFVTVPCVTLLGAYAWQMLPNHVAVRWGGWQRFIAIALTLPIGVVAGVVLGPIFERAVFDGDVTNWLGGQSGSAFGGWFFLLLPLAALVVAVGVAFVVTPRLRSRSGRWERGTVARFEALKFVCGGVLAVALAALCALLLQAVGMDPRGGLVDTYVQRNALIVGFVMGFAIVPIIYTLAEDSLSEVPVALREGSLGAGATNWQTTLRIVVPFAMSGIFSALMIGLGRAVGETMIVLMAAGNTPIMEWNAFSGFRTLSANIAVELPEAVVGSGHYRTLFLAALVLFSMTFVLNTFAEFVRRHFRRRFSGL